MSKGWVCNRPLRRKVHFAICSHGIKAVTQECTEMNSYPHSIFLLCVLSKSCPGSAPKRAVSELPVPSLRNKEIQKCSG